MSYPGPAETNDNVRLDIKADPILVAKKKKPQRKAAQHTTGDRTSWHRDSVLQGDAMTAGQSVSPILVLPQLL